MIPVQKQMLDGDQRWNCPACRCAQPTRRSTRVWKLPPIVVICLTRSSMRTAELIKNNVYVDFDINNFDMSKYLHEASLAAFTHHTNYQLYAVTVSRIFKRARARFRSLPLSPSP